MNLPISVAFLSSGSPQTGLTPNIDVFTVNQNDGSYTKVVDAQTMTEVSDGIYNYNYSGFNIRYNYVVKFDAGATSDLRVQYKSFSGLQALLDAIPRGGGGGTAVSLTNDQVKKISKSLKEQIGGFFDNVSVEFDQTMLDGTKKEIDSLIKDFKKCSDKERKDLAKLLDEKVKMIDKKVSEMQKPEITRQTVDISGFTSEMRQVISKQNKTAQIELENALADAILLIRKEVRENNEKYRDIVRAEVEAEVIAEFKTKLRS